MGVQIVRQATRRIRDLDQALVLAPERYDPRRTALDDYETKLQDVASLSGERVGPGAFDEEPCLVLGTGDAQEGIVLPEDNPVPSTEVGSRKVVLEPGDVIISRLRPYLRQVALIDEGLFKEYNVQHCLASTEFYVLRGHPEESISFLVPLLLADQVQEILVAAQEGGHHPRFNRSTLKEIGIPSAVLQAKERISAEFEQAVGRVREGKKKIVQTVDACTQLMSEEGQPTE